MSSSQTQKPSPKRVTSPSGLSLCLLYCLHVLQCDGCAACQSHLRHVVLPPGTYCATGTSCISNTCSAGPVATGQTCDALGEASTHTHASPSCICKIDVMYHPASKSCCACMLTLHPCVAHLYEPFTCNMAQLHRLLRAFTQNSNIFCQLVLAQTWCMQLFVQGPRALHPRHAKVERAKLLRVLLHPVEAALEVRQCSTILLHNIFL